LLELSASKLEDVDFRLNGAQLAMKDMSGKNSEEDEGLFGFTQILSVGMRVFERCIQKLSTNGMRSTEKLATAHE
jgi:hypothetical protein